MPVSQFTSKLRSIITIHTKPWLNLLQLAGFSHTELQLNIRKRLKAVEQIQEAPVLHFHTAD